MIFDMPDEAPASSLKTAVKPSRKRGAQRPAAKSGATPSKDRPKPGAVPTAQQAASQRELQIAAEAERLSPTVGDILIAGLGYVVGRELAPDEDMAQKMAEPLIRIGMRHVPVLLDVSPDAQDVGQLVAAVIIYSQTIGPELRAKRSEKRVTRGPGGYGRVINFTRNRGAATAAGRAGYPGESSSTVPTGDDAGPGYGEPAGHPVPAPSAASVEAVYSELGITLPG
jgi:hypothetical protein